MAIYKEIKIEGIEGSYIQRTDDDGTIWSIPIDPANSDYQAYLKWAEEQNNN